MRRFTRALLVLYSCFTLALLASVLAHGPSGAVRSYVPLFSFAACPYTLYSCFTHALLMLYSCFTHAFTQVCGAILLCRVPLWFGDACRFAGARFLVLLLVQKYALLRSSTNVRILTQLYVARARMPWCMRVESQLRIVLTYADVCGRMLAYADVCGRMLTYADVCCRMLAYARRFAALHSVPRPRTRAGHS